MVTAATWSGSPPLSAACRAGFWPVPALTTLPMMHSSTISGSIPARRTASATTSAPSSGAVRLLRTPSSFPVGVRTALTMTEERISFRPDFDSLNRTVAEKRLQTGHNDAARSLDLARPLRSGGFDDEGAALEFDGRRPLE